MDINGESWRKSMFLGTYKPNLIGKGRIALPKKIRNELAGNRLVLTIGFENCILGFAEKSWEEIVKPEFSRPFFSDQESRDLRRKMCMEAMVIELDSQGRFIIPETMMSGTDIKEQLTVIGAGDHFEIWNDKTWEDYRKKLNK